ncbi:hypothetical protein BU25DRAFT_453924 [Macroventuria anomochaeta]|uniref:Uncharacterized protein n=1 Tax=Macroventuria anomochaeta TaxID=301207 RepID=A0ACB6SI21_9PLEO|nr:uncharacterized protein BU25DRAFT_453924 [Macroventuria anomochaeta]KAF2632737.1 hypothetical protein BU25DRAFT_453924 [Macroventuria anomochaeta]
MSAFTYHHTRTRSRSRERTSPPPLPRRTSFKRQRLFLSDDEDDGYDDYPYAGNHRPSRALVRRDQPSQLERWNIWSDSRAEERCDSGNEESERERRRRHRRVSFADEHNEDEERGFRLRIARLTSERPRHLSPPPRRYQTESDDERARAHVWSAELLHRRERCVSEDYEARERARSRLTERRRRERSWGGDDEDEEIEREFDGERVVRWRRIKRTRTDEWRPLAGWRRV